MASIRPSSAAAPSTASRRAGPAYSVGVKTAAAAPALADALAPKSHGSSRRASCQTGTAVFARSVPVYVESAGPTSAATVSAATLTGFSTPSSSSAAAVPDAVPETNRTQLPTLIGEVTLKTRSMFRKRSGRPRSETRSTGLTRSPAAPT